MSLKTMGFAKPCTLNYLLSTVAFAMLSVAFSFLYSASPLKITNICIFVFCVHVKLISLL